MTDFENLFNSRLTNCRNNRVSFAQKWDRIDKALYRTDWENEKFLYKKENILLQTLKWNISDLNVTNYRPEINSIDIKNAKKAKQINNVINSEWDKQNITDLMQEVIKDKFIYGFGVLEVLFDDKVKVDKKLIGEIKVRKIDPRQIYFDTNARTFKEVNYLIIEQKIRLLTVLNLDYVKDDKKLIKKIFVNKSKYSYSENVINQEIEYRYTDKDEKENPLVSIYTYFSKKIENGNVEYWKHFLIDSKQGQNKFKIYSEKIPFNFFPFAILFDQKLPNQMYGTSLMEEMYFFQVAIDNVNEAISRSILSQSVPIFLLDKKAGIEAKDINENDEDIVKGKKIAKVLLYDSNNSQVPYKALDQNSISQDLIAQLNIQIDAAKRQGNLSPINTSQGTNSLSDRGSVALAQERASAFNQSSLMEIKIFCKKIVKLLLFFIKEYYTQTRSFSYTLDEVEISEENSEVNEQKFSFVKFNGSTIDESTIRYDIKIDALTKGHQEIQHRNLLEFFSILRQYQQVPNAILKESDLIKILDIPNKNELLSKALIQEAVDKFKLAEQILAICRQNIFLNYIAFLKNLKDSKIIDQIVYENILYNMGKNFGIDNIQEMADAEIDPNNSTIIQQISSILVVTVKK